MMLAKDMLLHHPISVILEIAVCLYSAAAQQNQICAFTRSSCIIFLFHFCFYYKFSLMLSFA